MPLCTSMRQNCFLHPSGNKKSCPTPTPIEEAGFPDVKLSPVWFPSFFSTKIFISAQISRKKIYTYTKNPEFSNQNVSSGWISRTQTNEIASGILDFVYSKHLYPLNDGRAKLIWNSSFHNTQLGKSIKRNLGMLCTSFDPSIISGYVEIIEVYFVFRYLKISNP